MQSSTYITTLWALYREYARYNKGKLLKEDTPADFLADLEKAVLYEADPLPDTDEHYMAAHFIHLRKYIEIINNGKY